jgi:hypothetical protein
VIAIDRAVSRLFTGPVQQVRKRLSTFGTEQAELVLLLFCLCLLDLDQTGRDWVMTELDKVRHPVKGREGCYERGR